MENKDYYYRIEDYNLETAINDAEANINNITVSLKKNIGVTKELLYNKKVLEAINNIEKKYQKRSLEERKKKEKDSLKKIVLFNQKNEIESTEINYYL